MDDFGLTRSKVKLKGACTLKLVSDHYLVTVKLRSFKAHRMVDETDDPIGFGLLGQKLSGQHFENGFDQLLKK